MALVDVIAQGGAPVPSIGERYTQGAQLADYLYEVERDRTVKRASRKVLSELDPLDETAFREMLPKAGAIDPEFGAQMNEMYLKFHPKGKGAKRYGAFQKIPVRGIDVFGTPLLDEAGTPTNEWDNITKGSGKGAGGAGGKPTIDIVTPANLEVLANSTEDALPEMYDLSPDGDKQYRTAYGQTVRDIAAAAKNAKVDLSISAIQNELKERLSAESTESGFGKYEINEFGRNAFNVDLWRSETTEIARKLINDVRLENLSPEQRVSVEEQEMELEATVTKEIPQSLIDAGITARDLMSQPWYVAGEPIPKHKLDAIEFQIAAIKKKEEAEEEEPAPAPIVPAAPQEPATTDQQDKTELDALFEELDAIPYTKKTPRSPRVTDPAYKEREREIRAAIKKIRTKQLSSRRSGPARPQMTDFGAL